MDILRLRHELESAINRASAENDTDTPDFILADYLISCLKAFNLAFNQRVRWYAKDQSSESGRFLDEFHGGIPELLDSTSALLKLDAEGALIPHGLGSHARGLLNALATRLENAAKIPSAQNFADENSNRVNP